MNYEKYAALSVSADALEFKFNSIGPKGDLTIVVQFAPTDDPSIYNLAFGNLLSNGSLDDHIKNDNSDRNKVLATIAATVYEFSSRYPGHFVFFTGSSASRTRLYRMAITVNYSELSTDFEIFGVNKVGPGFKAEPFAKGRDYFGFVVKRKISKFVI